MEPFRVYHRIPGADTILSGYRGRLLIVISLGTLAREIVRLILPPFLPDITAQLSISPTQAGLALTVLWGTDALFNFPGGRVSDQLSRKTVLMVSLGTLIAGCALLLTIQTYLNLLLVLFLIGIASGLYPVAAVAQISDEFVERRGAAIGVNIASANLGGILSGGLVVVILAVAPWRMVVVPLIAMLVVLFLSMHVVNRDAYRVALVDLDIFATGTRLLREPRLLVIILASALFSFAWHGAISFIPTLLQVEKGYTPAMASAMFALLFLVGAIANPLAGRLGDNAEYPLIAGSAALLAAVGIVVVVTQDTGALTVVGIVLLGVGLASYWPTMSAYFMSIALETSRGGDFGAARTIYLAFGSLGPMYVGATAERIGYSHAFTGLVAFVLISAAIMLRVARVR